MRDSLVSRRLALFLSFHARYASGVCLYAFFNTFFLFSSSTSLLHCTASAHDTLQFLDTDSPPNRHARTTTTTIIPPQQNNYNSRLPFFTRHESPTTFVGRVSTFSNETLYLFSRFLYALADQKGVLKHLSILCLEDLT